MIKQRDLFRFGFGVAVSVLGLAGVSSSATPQPQAESGVQVWLDDMHAVTYRARVEGAASIVIQPGADAVSACPKVPGSL